MKEDKGAWAFFLLSTLLGALVLNLFFGCIIDEAINDFPTLKSMHPTLSTKFLIILASLLFLASFFLYGALFTVAPSLHRQKPRA
jgi:uncharacterized BrkB/YihY/UPF0761 family membrane protein